MTPLMHSKRTFQGFSPIIAQPAVKNMLTHEQAVKLAQVHNARVEVKKALKRKSRADLAAVYKTRKQRILKKVD
jgi:hypothetical protein